MCIVVDTAFFFYSLVLHAVCKEAVSRGVALVCTGPQLDGGSRNRRTTMVTFPRLWWWRKAQLSEQCVLLCTCPLLWPASTVLWSRHIEQMQWDILAVHNAQRECMHMACTCMLVCADLHSALRSHRKLPHGYIAHGAMQWHCPYNYMTGVTWCDRISKWQFRALHVLILHCWFLRCAVVLLDLDFLYGIVWLCVAIFTGHADLNGNS